MRLADTPLSHRLVRLASVVCVLSAGTLSAQEVPADGNTGVPVDFASQVKPILAKQCFFCHGPDKAEGGLRLNQRDSVFSELGSGAQAVIPGNVEESEIILRVTSTTEGERMPPDGKPLSAEQVDILKRWIAQGAKWEEHWAFEKPVRHTPPQVKQEAWVTNPIDAFVLSKLEHHGLTPAAPADPAVLIRRAYYDLTGLPPTPDEIAAFVADTSPKAFENVIDRLLESPRYGERWGRHWLDLVRYADTNSFERDGNKPHAWRYRDYVIRSFNSDKPYDQFIKEQLAGDEQPDVTNDSVIATGFYRLGLWDDEPADRLQAKFDVLDDIVATTGQVFLGLTVNCARCHDHKIDPIPQRDYYQMLSFFHGLTPNGYGGPNVERMIFESEAARQRYDQQVAELEQRRNDRQAALQQLEATFRERYELAQNGPVSVVDLDDLEYRFYRDHWANLPDFDNLKPETVARLPRGLFDLSPATRESDFGFVFTGFLKVPQDGEYTFQLDSDDGSRLLIDGQRVLEYDGEHGEGNPRQAKVALKQGRLPVRLEYFQGGGGRGLTLNWSGPGFDARPLAAPRRNAGPEGPAIAELIKSRGAELLGSEQFQRYQTLQAELEQLKRERVPVDYAMCVTEVGPQAPETFVLSRGNPHVEADKVEPAFLELLGGGVPNIPSPPPGAQTSGRRKVLADWIASADNPMTARVMANRLWQHHFGRGIVRSTNNFGQLGDLPTHPELLDWLGFQLIDNGWRLKAMHKLIMLSSTYRMSSRPSAGALEKDPANDLFSRFDLRRLSAEEIRDSIHAVNGRLNLKMFGPGIYPQISAEVLAGQSVPGAGWGNSSPEEQARRSIYIHVKRSLITPILADFDFADTDSSCAARFTTTQPTQALGMLNGEFLNTQSAELAERVRKEAGDDPASQVRFALRVATGHEPEPASVERGVAFLKSFQTKYQLSPQQALTYYCLLVYNLNEFVYVD